MIELALGNLKWPHMDDPEKNLNFMLQLVSLHFLSHMMYDACRFIVDKFSAENTQNYQRVSELGGFERIMDFILWTFVYFGNLDAKLEIGERGKMDFLKDFMNGQLELGLVFDTLFSFCSGSLSTKPVKEEASILPLYALNHNYHLTESSVNNIVISTHQEAVMKTTLSLLLDLFNCDIRNTVENNAARLKLRYDYEWNILSI